MSRDYEPRLPQGPTGRIHLVRGEAFNALTLCCHRRVGLLSHREHVTQERDMATCSQLVPAVLLTGVLTVR